MGLDPRCGMLILWLNIEKKIPVILSTGGGGDPHFSPSRPIEYVKPLNPHKVPCVTVENTNGKPEIDRGLAQSIFIHLDPSFTPKMVPGFQ